jgi:hypothetical protein
MSYHERMSIKDSKALVQRAINVMNSRTDPFAPTLRFLMSLDTQINYRGLGLTAKQVIACRKIIKQTFAIFNGKSIKKSSKGA